MKYGRAAGRTCDRRGERGELVVDFFSESSGHKPRPEVTFAEPDRAAASLLQEAVAGRSTRANASDAVTPATVLPKPYRCPARRIGSVVQPSGRLLTSKVSARIGRSSYRFWD